MARTPPVAVKHANNWRLLPHLTHANTSSANILRSNSAQSTLGLLCFFSSCPDAASGATPATSSPA